MGRTRKINPCTVLLFLRSSYEPFSTSCPKQRYCVHSRTHPMALAGGRADARVPPGAGRAAPDPTLMERGCTEAAPAFPPPLFPLHFLLLKVHFARRSACSFSVSCRPCSAACPGWIRGGLGRISFAGLQLAVEQNCAGASPVPS